MRDVRWDTLFELPKSGRRAPELPVIPANNLQTAPPRPAIPSPTPVENDEIEPEDDELGELPAGDDEIEAEIAVLERRLARFTMALGPDVAVCRNNARRPATGIASRTLKIDDIVNLGRAPPLLTIPCRRP
jgi:hypothetical protein